MKWPLSTKDRIEIGIFRFLDGFIKYKIYEKDKEQKERANS